MELSGDGGMVSASEARSKFVVGLRDQLESTTLNIFCIYTCNVFIMCAEMRRELYEIEIELLRSF